MIVGISTSQSNINLVFGNNRTVLYQSEMKITPNSTSDIGSMFQEALGNLQMEVSEIEKILVDIGPGGTSSVRTGVAFANGLAYSLKIPILPISSIELIGMEVFEQYNIPVLVVFPSVKQNYYFGIYEGNEYSLNYGFLEEIVAKVEEKYKKIALAGYGKALNLLPNLMKRTEVKPTGVQKVNAIQMVQRINDFKREFQNYPNLPVPITEPTIT